MEKNEITGSVTIDFLLPATEERIAPIEVLKAPCRGCGKHEFTLASELQSDTLKGMPASRMFECVACGSYQLG